MRNDVKRLLALACCIGFVSCSQETSLPYGYKYFQIAPSIAAISDQQKQVVVDPNVVRYEVLGPYIVGERQDAELDPRFSDKFGFFILSMPDGRYIEGLSEAEFVVELRKRGLNTHPFEPWWRKLGL